MVDGPVPFGYKMSWLAVRSEDPSAVAKRLNLAELHKTTWSDGVDAIYDHENLLLITPPLDGWVLAAGLAVSQTGDPAADQQLLTLLASLSAEFGEAQALGTHRVVEHHYWMIARQGRLERAFAYLGESGAILLNDGEPTPAELSLFTGPADEWLPDEDNVLAVAAAWSVDPTTLDDDLQPEGSPLLGRIANK